MGTLKDRLMWWRGPIRWRPSLRFAMPAIWITAVIVTAVLYFESPDYGAAPGIAEVVEYELAPIDNERVEKVFVQPGQRVRKGEVVATLDSRPVEQELALARAQLAKAEGDLAAAIANARTTLKLARSYEAGVDQAEEGLLKAREAEATVRGELTGLRAQIEWWDSLVQAKLASAEKLIELKARAEALENRLRVQEEAVEVFEAKLEAAKRRLEAAGAEAEEGLDEAALARLAPLRAQVDVARANIAKLEARLDALTLRAPGDGVVRRVAVQPGEVATPQNPVVIIRAVPPRRIIAYASDTQTWTIRLGTPVRVTPRDGTRRALKGHVAGLGAGMVPYPQHLQTSRNWRIMWGEEVVVVLDEFAELVPGQVVDVTFLSEGHHTTDKQVSTATSDAKEHITDIADMRIPSSLSKRSVIEASGIIFIEEWGRFLIVSDDTGLPGQDEHPPWLFTMDADGNVDEEPVVVEGIESLNDLESVTRSSDGTLWVLSSQSVSRKGKRPESRTLLVRLKIDGRRVVATGSVSLTAVLARGDNEWLSNLGLVEVDPSFKEGIGGFDRVLNIEGMTAYGNALLFGLKRPLDAEGKAIVWRLAKPDSLIDTGELNPSDLMVAGRISLEGEGISDLMRLPSGGLAVLSVSLGDGPMHSALWTVIAKGSGEMEATRIKDFDGLHAEGIAMGPDREHVFIVFDRGKDVSAWTKCPLPQ